MGFKKFYMDEEFTSYINTILEQLVTPDNASDRDFDEVSIVEMPPELEGYDIETYHHGRMKGSDENLITSFGIDKDGKIKVMVIGNQHDPKGQSVDFTPEVWQDKKENVLYARSIALGDDGEISTKQIKPPFK